MDPRTTTALLYLSGVTVSFDGFRALNNLSFTIEPGTGHLAPLNRQPTGGYNPVHLAFDATGRFLAVCNCGTDSVVAFLLADDGSLLPYRTLTTVTGTLGEAKRLPEWIFSTSFEVD